MINNIYYLALFTILLSACATPTENDNDSKVDAKGDTEGPMKPIELTANEIVSKSYAYHGCEKINSESIKFDFRDYHLEYLHTDTGVVRIRSFQDTLGNEYKDVWSRLTLQRFKNGEAVSISEKKENAYKNSINSIFYFAFLPKSLRDPAVNLDYIDTMKIEEKKYHKIRVTFNEEGGGEDHEDIFMYWFDIEDYSMDYLAYSYNTNGGGMRFRAFLNRRTVNDIVFQDFVNYAPPEGAVFNQLDSLYNLDKLEQVSLIEQENIEVEGE